MQTGLINFDEIETQQVLPGCRAKFVHSENMTFAFWTIEQGSDFPKHSHPHEQVVNMLEGEYELNLEDQSYKLVAGDTFVIPSNKEHSGRSITECKILDVFYPIREDYS